jgi:hypothetical protein
MNPTLCFGLAVLLTLPLAALVCRYRITRGRMVPVKLLLGTSFCAALLSFVISCGLLELAGCGWRHGYTLSDQTKAIVAGNNAFALDLYGQLNTTNGNLFFSPFSISSCLAMTYAGARGNTDKQMAQVLHFGTNEVHSAFGELDSS